MPRVSYEKPGIRRNRKHDSEYDMTDGSKADNKGRLNPYSVTALGAGPAPDNLPENRQPVFPSQQSSPNVFRQEDPTQASRMLTLESQGQTVNLRPGSSGSGGIRSEGRQTITTPHDAAQPYQGTPPQYVEGNVTVTGQQANEAVDTGSGHSVTYQSQAWWNEKRGKVNPAAKGENQH
jgi:hypothetical protein